MFEFGFWCGAVCGIVIVWITLNNNNNKQERMVKDIWMVSLVCLYTGTQQKRETFLRFLPKTSPKTTVKEQLIDLVRDFSKLSKGMTSCIVCFRCLFSFVFSFSHHSFIHSLFFIEGMFYWGPFNV